MSERYLSTIPKQNWSQGMKSKYGEMDEKSTSLKNKESDIDQFIEAAYSGNMTKLLGYTTNTVIDCRNDKGVTPLISAAKGGQAKAVFFLLAKGANPSILDETGNSALHNAVMMEFVDVIDKLMVNCNPNEKNKEGQTILHIAVKENKSKSLEHIIKFSNLNFDEKDSKGDTAIHIAIKNRNLKCLSKLLTMPIDLSIHNLEGKNPLNLAVEEDELELLKMILDTKSGFAMLFNKTSYGESNLEIAIRERHKSVLDYLFQPEMKPEKMINTEIDKKFGATSLHWAVLQMDLPLVNKISDINCKLLNVKDKFGKTPLDHICSMHGFECSTQESIIDIAIQLIARGADMNLVQNKNGLYKLIKDTYILKFQL